jgi:hypothetical protein
MDENKKFIIVFLESVNEGISDPKEIAERAKLQMDMVDDMSYEENYNCGITIW